MAAPSPAPAPPGMSAAVTAYALHVPGDKPGTLPAALRGPACDGPEAAELLGRKGLLAKDQATRLALCAVHRALGRPPRAPRPTGPADPGAAVVVSSNLGNVATVAKIARETLDQGPRAVSPMDAPGASSNVIAGAIAIWFRLGGPNLTVCSGATAGLDAVRLACLLLRAGRARRVVVVGVEPDDADAALLHAARAGVPPGVPLRAAAACLVLEPAEAARAPVIELGRFAGREDTAAAWTPGELAGDLGDTYGAAGVLLTGLAVADVEGGGGPTRVICGDPEDGRRELLVRPR